LFDKSKSSTCWVPGIQDTPSQTHISSPSSYLFFEFQDSPPKPVNNLIKTCWWLVLLAVSTFDEESEEIRASDREGVAEKATGATSGRGKSLSFSS